MVEMFDCFLKGAWYQQCILISLTAIFGLQFVIAIFVMAPVIIKETLCNKLDFIEKFVELVFSVIFMIIMLVPFIGSLIVFMGIQEEKWFKFYMACSTIVFVAGVLGTVCSSI